jgi:hypothetical protein
MHEDKALEKLLGNGLSCKYLNDDKIGRVMDEIYQLGLTSLFIELGLLVTKKFEIETNNLNWLRRWSPEEAGNGYYLYCKP